MRSATSSRRSGSAGQFMLCGAPELCARYAPGLAAERCRPSHPRRRRHGARLVDHRRTRRTHRRRTHRYARRYPPVTTQPTTATGLVAILRGITPAEVVAIGDVLADEGFAAIEVPMNSPDPLRSIEILAGTVGTRCAVGAGTVTTLDELVRTESAGARDHRCPQHRSGDHRRGRFPGAGPLPRGGHTDRGVHRDQGRGPQPQAVPVRHLGNRRHEGHPGGPAPGNRDAARGGVDESNLAAWAAAGAGGAGIGSCLYRPGDGPDDVRRRARALTEIWSPTSTSYTPHPYDRYEKAAS